MHSHSLTNIPTFPQHACRQTLAHLNCHKWSWELKTHFVLLRGMSVRSLSWFNAAEKDGLQTWSDSHFIRCHSGILLLLKIKTNTLRRPEKILLVQISLEQLRPKVCLEHASFEHWSPKVIVRWSKAARFRVLLLSVLGPLKYCEKLLNKCLKIQRACQLLHCNNLAIERWTLNLQKHWERVILIGI